MSNDNYTIQSALRALDVLIWLSENGGRGRITDIAAEVGCSKNTAFRLMHTLMKRDFVRQADDSSYELTFKLLNLGEIVLQETEVHHVARPYLQSLASETGETTTLAILDGDEVIYLDRVLGSSPFQTSYSVGSRAKAHTTALGKAILAFSPERVIEHCLKGPLKANTPHTVTDPDLARKELRGTAQRYYAVDSEENVLGVRCLGAPIFDRNGDVIASVSISGLAVHMSESRVRALADPLRQTAAAVSERMGFRGVYASELVAADGS